MMFRSIGNGIGGCLGGGYFGGGYGLMHNGLGMIIMLAVTALIVTGIVILAKKSVRGSGSGDAALETLKMRFAAGEITEEEFLKKKTILK